jgi:endonuclease-3 related protein
MNFGHCNWLFPKLKPVTTPSAAEKIREIYSTLTKAWGPQHWWPAQSRFEVIVGAYLTQNTSWRNVELALRNLRSERALSVQAIREISIRRLEKLVRPSGYYRQKARSLKTFIRFLDRRYGGSLTRMFKQPTAMLREELLNLSGVGPETADSILLYAGQHPVFVVDSYTRRLAARHGILNQEATYEEFRAVFERALNVVPASEVAVTGSMPAQARGSAAHPPSRMSLAKRAPLAQVFNDMHGLVVSAGKQYCLKSNPRCGECPLGRLLSADAADCR